MKNSAFEITSDDVRNVLFTHKVVKSYNEVEAIFDGLDADEVENAALHGDEMDKQIDYAYSNIEEQNIVP